MPNESPAPIPVHAPVLDAATTAAVMACLERTEISGNAPTVRQFEAEFAAWLGVKHAIAVSSGTTALRLALSALGVGLGDEVVLPSMTFAPCADTIVHAGATPVFVDCEPDRLQLDVRALAAAITDKTRVVMAVHAYGQSADLDAVERLCDERGVILLEDAAQALGSRCHARAVGTIGKAACFSLYANKLLTTGEGGMVVTDDADVAALARSLRSHGMVRGGKPYEHEACGFNFRLPALSAALGLAQIPQLDERLSRRQQVADRYRTGLENVPGLRMLAPAPWTTRHAWWGHVVMIEPQGFGAEAAAVAELLRSQNIATRRLYHPLHLHAPLRAFAPNAHDPNAPGLPVCEAIAPHGLVLPSGNGLTDAEIDRVVAVLVAFAEQVAA
ncbi:MAG: DegT/DnrJ/EryC1/StrS family aminotransferase [Myxococcales bacterium]|nr:DegT/DnrJ/EryC1/StrS family aminotransferase [Myxococcales bacterium]